MTTKKDKSKGIGGGGPPLKFETPEELQEEIDDYFNNIEDIKITQSGLCLHLYLTKPSFNNYLTKPGYEKIVALAKLKIEQSYENALRSQGGAGNIFALKNFGWIDKQEREYSGNPDRPLVTKIVREIVRIEDCDDL